MAAIRLYMYNEEHSENDYRLRKRYIAACKGEKSMTKRSVLKSEELDVLTKNFRLTIDPLSEGRQSVAASQLLDESGCSAYLEWLSGILNSPSAMITASQFAKRYAFLTAAPVLYAMTLYNKGLNLSIDNCHIESIEGAASWQSNIRLSDARVTSPETREQRYAWRDDVISNLFAGNLAKIWRSMSRAANVPMAIMWENTAVRVYSLYEKKIVAGASAEEKLRIQEDFDYLLHKAPAVLYGDTRNPIARFYVPSPKAAASNPSVRVRKTCCYYYKVSSPEEYCTTCPKLQNG
ncbi:Ferric iron reductase FhuF-like transporter [compost metagenome]